MENTNHETLCPECGNTHNWTWTCDLESSPETPQPCDRCGRKWGDNEETEQIK